jgi:integrase
MATIRKRANGTWQVTVRRSPLPRPHYASFDTEEEAESYATNLEQLLDRGIIPESLKAASLAAAKILLGNWITEYLNSTHVSQHDREVLSQIDVEVRATPVEQADLHWVMAWVNTLKREHKLVPGTIRKRVGALARCVDWCVLTGRAPLNPFRQLPKKYATYNPSDGEKQTDTERDRRLEPGEYEAILRVLALEKPEGKERPIDGTYVAAWVCLFDLAVETAMRLREMFTLTLSQVDFKKRTVFLDKTKNGDKRQVPLSSVAIAALEMYLDVVQVQGGGMAGFRHESGLLFPWWDGNPDSLKKTTAALSAKWRRVSQLAGCQELHFHDLRHEATCRLYERTTLTDVQIARITGHRTLVTLKRYASLRGSDLADSLW